MSENIAAATLPYRRIRFNLKAKIAGWGNTTVGYPESLKKLRVLLVPSNRCQERYPPLDYQDRRDIICAHRRHNEGYGSNNVIII